MLSLTSGSKKLFKSWNWKINSVFAWIRLPCSWSKVFISSDLLGTASFLKKLFMKELHHIKIQRWQHPRLKKAVVSGQTCKAQDKFSKISHLKSLHSCRLTWHRSEVNMNYGLCWFQIILFKMIQKKKTTKTKQNLIS